jgi:ParB family chromosome partitioning protein
MNATAVKETQKKMQAAAVKEAQVMFVPIGLIKSGDNARKAFDAKKMDELTHSIREHGVVTPVTLRPGNGGDYILVAGERRVRAALAVGLKQVPAQVLMELSDASASICQLVENLQREDLGVMEEAAGLKKLMGNKALDAKSIGDMVGKSPAYVYRSVRLLELPDNAQKMIAAGTLTAAHGHQILRVAPEERQDLVNFVVSQLKRGGISVSELRGHVDEEMGGDLKRAAWPLDVVFAGKPACKGCQFNSRNQTELFDDAAAGHCCDGDCYKKKAEALESQRMAALQKEHPGMKVLPTGRSYEAQYRGWTSVRPEQLASKAVKQLIAANPGDFAVTMMQDYEYKGAKTIMANKAACQAILQVMPKGDSDRYHYGGSNGSGSGGNMAETAEKKFLRKQTECGILDAIAAASAKIEKRHWVAIATQLYNANRPEHTVKTAGVVWRGSSGQGNGLYESLEQLPLEKIQVLAVQLAVWPYARGQYENNWREPILRRLGLDAAKVVKNAKAAAAAAWKAKKGVK